ncbi:hypothetical protein GC098_21770 [Paenibacillus sp. LMG 31458]|uniref:Uncharacterized protein n=1 Tax=Paenibacillus phytorum TaxID=2654977 RepID=A0ABX1XZJ1_9BACL|nr:hypothetical protein [Paenibacillus phytorum]
MPGPEEDDINTMHRYRDAAYHDKKKNHRMKRFQPSNLSDYAGGH